VTQLEPPDRSSASFGAKATGQMASRGWSRPFAELTGGPRLAKAGPGRSRHVAGRAAEVVIAVECKRYKTTPLNDRALLGELDQVSRHSIQTCGSLPLRGGERTDRRSSSPAADDKGLEFLLLDGSERGGPSCSLRRIPRSAPALLCSSPMLFSLLGPSGPDLTTSDLRVRKP
jgi:hypothetical protein